jgi:hypothetical protein
LSGQAFGATRNGIKRPKDALRASRKLAALRQSGPLSCAASKGRYDAIAHMTPNACPHKA